MATRAHDNPIEAPDAAVPALSEEDKAAAAEAEAKAAAEAKKNAHKDRYVLYVVPGRAAANRVDPETKEKLASRPSENPNPSGTYGARVGVASVEAVIRPQDWPAHITATDTLRWEFPEWRVPAARLSEEQIDWLLNEEPKLIGARRFELVDGNGNKVDQ